MLEWFLHLFNFRGPGHQVWFIVTVLLLALILNKVRRNVVTRPDFIQPAFIHFAALVLAVMVIVLLRQPESDGFSRDCIWFNASMTMIYGVLYLRFKKMPAKTRAKKLK